MSCTKLASKVGLAAHFHYTYAIRALRRADVNTISSSQRIDEHDGRDPAGRR